MPTILRELPRTYHLLPFSNGVAAAVYNRRSGFVDGFTGHIFHQLSPGMPTLNLVDRVAAGLRWGKKASWLGGIEPESLGYRAGTGIVEALYRLDGLEVSCWYFTPQDPAERLLTVVMELRNSGQEPVRECAFYLYLAALVGSGENRTGHGWVSYHPSSGLVLAGSSDTEHVILARAIRADAAQIRFCGGTGAEMWNRALQLPRIQGGSEVWVGENLQGVYQGHLGDLGVGETKCIGVVLGYEPGADEEKARFIVESYVGGRAPRQVVDDEAAWWDRWTHRGRSREQSLPEFEKLHDHALIALKMGQCREAGRLQGQILASLPPGHWNIAWVRDGAYSIAALAAWERFEEARNALLFMLAGEAGYYREYIWNKRDFGVGVPYQVSVCRYFGNGREESDGEPPNIELDGFGLFLWAFYEYWHASGDGALLKAHWDTLKEKIATPIIHAVSPRGIIRPESGPWETHLPGASFAYTSIVSAAGLARAARMAIHLGESDLAALYDRSSAALYASVLREFSGPGGVLLGKPADEEPGYLDGSVVEAVNLGLASNDEAWVTPTMAAIKRSLSVHPDRGYCRNNEPGEYNEQEWVFIDLRLAEALVRLGSYEEAGRLLRWVLSQTAANDWLFAELYRRRDGSYDGAVPMCGFGAGAFLLLEKVVREKGMTLCDLVGGLRES